jgi:hypothetical protein
MFLFVGASLAHPKIQKITTKSNYIHQNSRTAHFSTCIILGTPLCSKTEGDSRLWFWVGA